MYLKLMSAQDLPDADGSKTFRMVEGRDIQFYRNGFQLVTGPVAVVVNHDGESIYSLMGNAYILNNSGKTIDSFAYSEPSVHKAVYEPHVYFEGMGGQHGVHRQLSLMLAEAIVRKDEYDELLTRQPGDSSMSYGAGICSGEVGVLATLLRKCDKNYVGFNFTSGWAKDMLQGDQKADDSAWVTSRHELR